MHNRSYSRTLLVEGCFFFSLFLFFHITELEIGILNGSCTLKYTFHFFSTYKSYSQSLIWDLIMWNVTSSCDSNQSVTLYQRSHFSKSVKKPHVLLLICGGFSPSGWTYHGPKRRKTVAFTYKLPIWPNNFTESYKENRKLKQTCSCCQVQKNVGFCVVPLMVMYSACAISLFPHFLIT